MATWISTVYNISLVSAMALAAYAWATIVSVIYLL